MIKDLTPKEKEEFTKLKTKLFGNEKFVIFSDEELNSSEHKRYDFLLRKKMEFMKNELAK